VIQIGSKCAKEYFGIESDAFLTCQERTFFTDYAVGDEELLEMLRGNNWTACAWRWSDILPFLDYATSGFLKWNKSGEWYDPMAPLTEQATVEAVRTLVTTPPENLRDGMLGANWVDIGLTPDDAIAYWERQREGSLKMNALSTLRAGYATPRLFGAFCYAMFAAFNDKAKKMRDARNAALPSVPCRFSVGSRADLEGVITGIREWVGQDGNANYYNNYCGNDITLYTVDFTDNAGTRYHFTTSGATFTEVATGDKVKIRATIGETKTFQGRPYTRLSRPRCFKI
jgi:hypothetical protein